tara:strand:+ start:55 stop:363 length:309 start_codon:yes stop_codon:yes gene_type:complete
MSKKPSRKERRILRKKKALADYRNNQKYRNDEVEDLRPGCMSQTASIFADNLKRTLKKTLKRFTRKSKVKVHVAKQGGGKKKGHNRTKKKKRKKRKKSHKSK